MEAIKTPFFLRYSLNATLEIYLIATRTIGVYGWKGGIEGFFDLRKAIFLKGYSTCQPFALGLLLLLHPFPHLPASSPPTAEQKFTHAILQRLESRWQKKKRQGIMGGRQQCFLQARKCHLSLPHIHCHRKSEFLAHPSHNTLIQLVIQPPQISHVHTTFSIAAHKDNGWSVMSVQKHREALGQYRRTRPGDPVLWSQLMHPYTLLSFSLAFAPSPAWPLWEKDRVGHLHTCSVLQCYKQHAP